MGILVRRLNDTESARAANPFFFRKELSRSSCLSTVSARQSRQLKAFLLYSGKLLPLLEKQAIVTEKVLTKPIFIDFYFHTECTDTKDTAVKDGTLND